ncbi:phosphotransferase enzyme family protein [Mongoliitalea daihaiensis]|uniref:phosphotransferase enzyme family protein n=1 Tax=Mongoliitalea daihaiensis TaxID=2782006 RepID=UPI001F327DDB|nr:aminoglycoside phosphotransferase family protein [Mongoliitalea daihaiensis]UJP66036.1 aminoglycoside phosphotransferase family protein [Mongoliitalea daihaiensis]
MQAYPWITALQEAYGMTLGSIERLGTGHIHQTFKFFWNESAYVLQQFNAKVFTQPDRISSNHALLIVKLKSQQLPFQLPLPIPNLSGQLFTQEGQALFRISPFVEGLCLDEVEGLAEARLAAEAFARFIEACTDVDALQFQETIPAFHDLDLRFQQLKEAYAQTQREITDELQALLTFYLGQEKLVEEYNSWIQKLPLRVTHNDTKVNNLIFSLDKKEVSAVIDLDTIMGGYAMYDFGDLVRTVACTQPESSIAWDKISLDPQKYAALWEGFVEGGKNFLTTDEIASLAFGGKMMTCIMGFRFLADYLHGNIYYSIHYENQNLHRAKNQMLLLQALEDFSFHP